MTQESKNLDLWKAWLEVPEDKRKAFDKKTYAGTSWDPTWAFGEATRLWGPYGSTWGLRNTEWTMVGSPPDAIVMTCQFFYPGGAFDMAVDHPYIRGRETMKILQTDIVKKALTKLGAAKEIYLGKFDNDAYAIIADDPKQRNPRDFAADAIEAIKTADSTALGEIVGKCRDVGLKSYYLGQVLDAEHKRRLELKNDDSIGQMEDLFNGEEKTAVPDGPTETTDPD